MSKLIKRERRNGKFGYQILEYYEYDEGVKYCEPHQRGTWNWKIHQVLEYD